MTNKNLLDVEHICYSVSYKDMVKTWVFYNFRQEFVIVVWNARANIEVLRAIGLLIFDTELYDSELLVLHATSLEDLLYISEKLQNSDSTPFYQAWGLGNFLFDSVDATELDT